MSLWGDLAGLVQRVLTLGKELEQNRTDIKEIRAELRELTIIVHALAQDNKNSKEQAAQRHENLLLELENRLLKYEKALPSASKKATKRRPKR
jgi:chromosome segregation ATPase